MSVLNFILDGSILNAHAFLKAIANVGERIINPSQMKKQIFSQLWCKDVRYEQEIYLHPV